jgi:hypothetical protein
MNCGSSALLRSPGRYWDLPLVFILILAAFYSGSNLLSLVHFDQERIEIWTFEGQIQVRGLYHYRNRSPLPLSFSLRLPFPVDSEHGRPAIFSVAEVDPGGAFLSDVDARNYHGDAVFRLWFGPHQDKWIRVDYVQGSRTSGGRYILLTTRRWNRPLDHGEYTLHLGDGLELVSSNYALQPEADKQSSFSFARMHFYPSEDWVFTWRKVDSLSAARENRP